MLEKDALYYPTFGERKNLSPSIQILTSQPFILNPDLSFLCLLSLICLICVVVINRPHCNQLQWKLKVRSSPFFFTILFSLDYSLLSYSLCLLCFSLSIYFYTLFLLYSLSHPNLSFLTWYKSFKLLNLTKASANLFHSQFIFI